jgi:hypothetical protein
MTPSEDSMGSLGGSLSKADTQMKALLEAFRDNRPARQESPALLALSEDVLDLALACIDVIRWSSPVDPFADGTPPAYPDGYYARELGFSWPDTGHKATGAQVQLLTLAITDLMDGKPPITGDVFTARIHGIMKGES